MIEQEISISLVLATYGRTDDLDVLISSLIIQTDKRFELIVVDQNLDERLSAHVERARLAGLAVKHLRMDKPNLSKARNIGLAVAEGAWVAFPDDDCWYENDTLATILSAPANGIDAWVIAWAEQEEVVGHPVIDHCFNLDVWRHFRGGDASSITLIFRRELAINLNGFDERLGVGQWFGAAEETDFVLRALEIGAHIRRLPLAKVHHRFAAVGEGQPTDVSWRVTLARARGTGALYAKHHLPIPVVVRGFLAPVPLAIWRRTYLRSAFANSLGRIQGWWSWNR